MHVLTCTITNIKHVYITNKIDRISKWIHRSTSLNVATIYFRITGPFEMYHEILENLSKYQKEKDSSWKK